MEIDIPNKKPFRVHVIGPDEYHDHGNLVEALAHANELNRMLAEAHLKDPNNAFRPYCLAIVESDEPKAEHEVFIHIRQEPAAEELKIQLWFNPRLKASQLDQAPAAHQLAIRMIEAGRAMESDEEE